MNKKLLTTLVAVSVLTWSIAYAATTHYGFVLPTVGASQNTWGSLLNTIFNTIDTDLWAVAGGRTTAVNAPSSSPSNITLTNPVSSVQNISFSNTGLKLILPAMNATSSMVAGGDGLVVNNVGSNAFSITAADGTTTIVSSLLAGQSVTIIALTNATSNGTFQVLGPYLTAVGTLPLGTSTSTTNPAISGDTTTGFYTAGAGKVDVAVSGTNVVEWASTGETLAAAPKVTPFSTAGVVTNNSSGTLISTTALPSTTTATTPSVNDNSTKVATTAYVDRAVPVLHQQVFTSSGTFTAPAGATASTVFKFTEVGAGGGGGGCSSSQVGAGGGGAGATAIYYTTLTASTGYTVTVGTGGAGGVNASDGSPGGATTVVIGATTVTANGGGGGAQGSSTATKTGGGGGTAANGTLNFTGGAGGFGIGQTLGSAIQAGGKGGDSSFGGGGLSPVGASQAGIVGQPNSGGGGSGATGGTNQTGGGGGSGIVTVEWVL